MAKSQSITFNPALPAGVVSSGSVTDAQAELAALRAENARLKAEAAAKVKVMILEPKGERKDPLVAVVGVRRFPVSFYRQEWDKILSVVDTVRAACASVQARK